MGSERKQRRFWDHVYNRFAWLYDAIDVLTFNTTQRYRLAILPFIPENAERVLEIGIGPGKLHRILARDYTLAGIDLAWGMVRLTQKRLCSENSTSFLCQGDAYSLPWAQSSFDTVVLSFVFSAIPDGERAFSEMLRVLRPEGSIIILDAGEADNENYFAHSLAILWEQFGDYIRDERVYMERVGMQITRQELGPGGCVHIVVGTGQSQNFLIES